MRVYVFSEWADDGKRYLILGDYYLREKCKNTIEIEVDGNCDQETLRNIIMKYGKNIGDKK